MMMMWPVSLNSMYSLPLHRMIRAYIINLNHSLYTQ